MKATSLPPWAFWLSCGRIRGADRLESAAGQIAAAGGQPRTALKVLDGLVVRIVDADFRLAPVDPACGRPPVGGRGKGAAGGGGRGEGRGPPPHPRSPGSPPSGPKASPWRRTSRRSMKTAPTTERGALRASCKA